MTGSKLPEINVGRWSTTRQETRPKRATTLNPEHLFEQAERLISPRSSGAPRQADVRRALSSAYYGAFHALLAAGADAFVGKTKRLSPEYALVYRRVEHKGVLDLCLEVTKTTTTAKYARYQPRGGFAGDIRSFAEAMIELQRKRHEADYNPLFRTKTADARLAIDSARAAVRRLHAASAQQRRPFLGLLLFPPR